MKMTGLALISVAVGGLSLAAAAVVPPSAKHAPKEVR